MIQTFDISKATELLPTNKYALVLFILKDEFIPQNLSKYNMAHFYPLPDDDPRLRTTFVLFAPVSCSGGLHYELSMERFLEITQSFAILD